ncbi:MAG: hypothetical protein AVDCRST_MAG57-3385 [uncultured Blastococcus sp.]|uniref:Uncharacterized protein n=1 Tax=uncultured Blastococcus sp. TaxID=217144 RepID=A0A6J4J9G4_9ACTN|nr:MAG: hypothetical protein AVDCRST_MAG57-3385 [uncultured Blastococcus sp.]
MSSGLSGRCELHNDPPARTVVRKSAGPSGEDGLLGGDARGGRPGHGGVHRLHLDDEVAEPGVRLDRTCAGRRPARR